METNLFGTPSLITRNTNDVQQVQMVIVMALTVMILAPIMAVGGVIMALREDVPLSSVLVVIVPLMALIMGGLVLAGAAALPGDAGQDRPHQPGHAREPRRACA